MSEQKRIHIILPLVVAGIICTVVLLSVEHLASEKIIENAQKHQLRVIDSVMPLPYDNEPHRDVIQVVDPGYLGNNNAVSIYRVRKENNPVGLIMMPIIARGYTGNISLVVGIAYDGTLLGVNVIEHQETEGLGDQIHQDNSDWINGFKNRSINNTPLERWAVKDDGGDFDQLSGATITPRAVVNAVRQSLEFYQMNQDRLYLE